MGLYLWAEAEGSGPGKNIEQLLSGGTRTLRGDGYAASAVPCVSRIGGSNIRYGRADAMPTLSA
jgi:hypothetical protein